MVNKKNIFMVLVCVIAFWAVVGCGILFVVEQQVIAGNHSLEQYIIDNNCGNYLAYQKIDRNAVINDLPGKLGNIGSIK